MYFAFWPLLSVLVALNTLPSKKKASQDYLYYNADAPLEYFEMELEDASRAGKPATRSSSSTDDGAPPSKKPKPRFKAHGKYTTVENALETACTSSSSTRYAQMGVT